MKSMNIFDLFLKSDFLLKFIFSFLLFFSILSWVIIFYKIFTLRYIQKEIENFENNFYSDKNINFLYEEQEHKQNTLVGYARIFYLGFKEYMELKHLKNTPESILDRTKHIMNVVVNREIEVLETHISTLGSISAISPYIGLLGTVWGIMNIFYKINDYTNFTIQSIAPDISDALSTTAMSLFVAIPALISFNKFSVKSNVIAQNYLNFSEECAAILYRKIISKKD
ncbi:TolAQR complex membrane spanning protein [Wigglesworthia glossinidia endosymbiont of Glossina morsitans morsitans (Yale colony)]|uniref:TolAQR complex membrane spanning protein n=2 Tax=Wigglesworthia glossinidia TaxID=51229 RepID=H6Q5Y6_WIGGL|nr:TolAQR complex membrane spanning protein [Wigglesworthia glossinidia endosymbiont of Glossina morsitans morsitans (Yale colony)]